MIHRALLVPLLLPLLLSIIPACHTGPGATARAPVFPAPPGADAAMTIRYLEIVTPDVDAVCADYAASLGLAFGDLDMSLGNARTATLPGGGLLGVRAPLHEAEVPVVRPYWLVDDIEAAVAAAQEAGAEVLHPPLLIPGHGTFAITLQGGIQHGYWQD